MAAYKQFEFNETTGVPTKLIAGWVGGKWMRGKALNINDKPLFDYTGGKRVGSQPSRWGAYSEDVMKSYGGRINISNLMEPAKGRKPLVKFLRSGKQWAVIVG